MNGFDGMKPRFTMSNYNVPRPSGPVIGPPRQKGTQDVNMFNHVMKPNNGARIISPFGKLKFNVRP